jgi:hypothetical protein
VLIQEAVTSADRRPEITPIRHARPYLNTMYDSRKSGDAFIAANRFRPALIKFVGEIAIHLY